MFVDESGFLLIPTVWRTWAPRWETPYLRHRYRHDRLSVCSGVAVSPRRRQIALYLHCRPRNLTGRDIETFLRHLLRHLRGPVDLLWDRGPIHRRGNVQRFRARHPRLHIPFFPAYAPELNPAEYVWGQGDRALANGARMIWPRSATPLVPRSVASVARRTSCGPVSTPRSCRGPGDPFHCLGKTQ